MTYFTVIYITANEEIPSLGSVKSFQHEEDAYGHAVELFMQHVILSTEEEPEDREKYENIVKATGSRKHVFEELLRHERRFFYRDAIKVFEINLD